MTSTPVRCDLLGSAASNESISPNTHPTYFQLGLFYSPHENKRHSRYATISNELRFSLERHTTDQPSSPSFFVPTCGSQLYQPSLTLCGLPPILQNLRERSTRSSRNKYFSELRSVISLRAVHGANNAPRNRSLGSLSLPLARERSVPSPTSLTLPSVLISL